MRPMSALASAIRSRISDSCQSIQMGTCQSDSVAGGTRLVPRPASYRTGFANVHYLRHGVFFVLIATTGQHMSFEDESHFRDVRRAPIKVRSYRIGYPLGVTKSSRIRYAAEDPDCTRTSNR